MTEFYFAIYEDGGGYKGLVYDDNGEEIEDSWEVEELLANREFFNLGTEIGLMNVRSSEVKMFFAVAE